MFKSIKAQITAYKWVIIVSLIGILAIFAGVNYHRASMLAEESASLKEKTIAMETTIIKNQQQFTAYKESTEKALADIKNFREALAEINGKTADLQKRVNGLKTAPAPGGANAQQLEDDANKLTKDVFKRMEDSSRGKTK